MEDAQYGEDDEEEDKDEKNEAVAAPVPDPEDPVEPQLTEASQVLGASDIRQVGALSHTRTSTLELSPTPATPRGTEVIAALSPAPCLTVGKPFLLSGLPSLSSEAFRLAALPLPFRICE